MLPVIEPDGESTVRPIVVCSLLLIPISLAPLFLGMTGALDAAADTDRAFDFARCCQEEEFERLGSTQTLRVNVRVVAATNQDLAQLVSKKLFRADLFYRLNVIPLCLPPLRERVQDIVPLTEFFVAKFAARLNKAIYSIPDEVVEVLKAHDWPGNIRELQNFLERAVLFSPGSVLRLPLDLKQTVMKRSESVSRTLADADREHILETLEQANWLIGGQDGAANRLGLPRTTLIYKMRKLGIETRRSPRARGVRPFAPQGNICSSCNSTEVLNTGDRRAQHPKQLLMGRS